MSPSHVTECWKAASALTQFKMLFVTAVNQFILFDLRAWVVPLVSLQSLSLSNQSVFPFFPALDLNILKHFRARRRPGRFWHLLHLCASGKLHLFNVFLSLFLLYQPLRGVVILKQAIDKMQMNTNQLTSVHADLCQVSHSPCCIVAMATDDFSCPRFSRPTSPVVPWMFFCFFFPSSKFRLVDAPFKWVVLNNSHTGFVPTQFQHTVVTKKQQHC